jgi:hypothetical protein
MFYIIKKINYDKIKIKYLYKKQIYKIYYDLNNSIDIIGIPLSLKYHSLRLHYNLVYVYFTDYIIIQKINHILYKNIGINIIKHDIETAKKYIVCKNTNNVKIESDNININISKIITTNGNYVPLIYII